MPLAWLAIQGLGESPEDFPKPPVSAAGPEAMVGKCDADRTRVGPVGPPQGRAPAGPTRPVATGQGRRMFVRDEPVTRGSTTSH
jgi:hypothetical protein